ncbi:hypothetical protein V502_03634 [Pseudogymnoascus sp. VKM F-4520 (FW-2644)]|nr:hypothetical protein V502_03634 [Pseudogymnoascus sp. VKM F-4520 (FW-2644)]
MPSLSLRPSLRSRASSHSNMLHARSPASGPPSPGGGMERSSYFMTSASASSPSAEMARYGGCTSNPWMNGESSPLFPLQQPSFGGWFLGTAVALCGAGTGHAARRTLGPGSGYTPTSQLPPQQQQQQSSTQQIQAQQAQTQSDPQSRSHRPGTDTRTPTPLSALGGAAENLGSYFSPWSSECAHTPPLGSRGPDDELKTSEQDGFFAHRTTHTSSSTSSTAAAAVPQIHLQHRHTHDQTRPHLRPPPPRGTATFPLTMAVAQGKYHPSNYRNPEMPTSQPATASAASSPTITTSPPSASSPPTTQSPLSPPAQAADTRRLLLQYQRDMVEAAARAAQLSISRSPASPRLGPLGSPGPVTPWELEGEGSGGGWLERNSSADTTTMTKGGGEGKEGEEKGDA